jgi:hypothetical protein
LHKVSLRIKIALRIDVGTNKRGVGDGNGFSSTREFIRLRLETP